MSATPRELSAHAAELLKTAESEPHYRAVCSRSYYAAFHAARAFHHALPVPGLVGKASGSHEQLIAQLANPQCSRQNRKFLTSQAISKRLRPLFDARVKADYHIDVEIDRGLAAHAVTGADTILRMTE